MRLTGAPVPREIQRMTLLTSRMKRSCHCRWNSWSTIKSVNPSKLMTHWGSPVHQTTLSRCAGPQMTSHLWHQTPSPWFQTHWRGCSLWTLSIPSVEGKTVQIYPMDIQPLEYSFAVLLPSLFSSLQRHQREKERAKQHLNKRNVFHPTDLGKKKQKGHHCVPADPSHWHFPVWQHQLLTLWNVKSIYCCYNTALRSPSLQQTLSVTRTSPFQGPGCFLFPTYQ